HRQPVPAPGVLRTVPGGHPAAAPAGRARRDQERPDRPVPQDAPGGRRRVDPVPGDPARDRHLRAGHHLAHDSRGDRHPLPRRRGRRRRQDDGGHRGRGPCGAGIRPNDRPHHGGWRWHPAPVTAKWVRPYAPGRGRWLIIAWELGGLALLLWSTVRMYQLGPAAAGWLGGALVLLWLVGSWRILRLGVYVSDHGVLVRRLVGSRVLPSRRIDLHDITTPANERTTRAVNDPDPTPKGRTRAGATGNLIFLAGVWLVISGFSLFYRDTGVFDAYWNDVVVGIALATVALVGIVKPAGSGSLTLTKIVLGGWLVAAPFAL